MHTIRYDRIRYIYVRSKADGRAAESSVPCARHQNREK